MKSWPVLLSRIYIALAFNCRNNHKKLEFENFTLTVRQPNNCCILQNKTVLLIEYIGTKDEETVVIARKFLKKSGIQNYPTDSTQLGIYQVEKLSELEIVSVKNIVQKCCLLVYKGIQYAIPLLHR